MDDRNAITAPANAIHRYILRDRNEISTITPERSTDCPYSVGDAVWVRPHAGRCDSQYCKGLVTRVISDQAIEIDGMPRHVRDVRRRNRTPQQTFGSAPQPVVNDPTEEYPNDQSRWVGIPTHAEEPVPTQSVQDQRQAKTDPRRSTRIRQQTRCRLLSCRPADCSGDQEGQRNATWSQKKNLLRLVIYRSGGSVANNIILIKGDKYYSTFMKGDKYPVIMTRSRTRPEIRDI
uniref:DUF5641 domain-containing protein n=1 Tax=Trichuris muris TaxID=70415 RepID=A0A5S6Q0C0_TRIMR